jgi:hypothetical protein
MYDWRRSEKVSLGYSPSRHVCGRVAPAACSCARARAACGPRGAAGWSAQTAGAGRLAGGRSGGGRRRGGRACTI